MEVTKMPRSKRFIKLQTQLRYQVGKAIQDYAMIEAGDPSNR